MAWAWAEYRKMAWGQDEIRPVSGTGKSFLIPGQTVGLSIVEALDTLWLMGLDAELEDGVRWIRQSLRFDLDGDAQMFEATIRLVGGLLSGHLATGEAKLLELAHDLATRMMPAFDTPTGMPMRYVNLVTGKTRDPLSFPAEIGGGPRAGVRDPVEAHRREALRRGGGERDADAVRETIDRSGCSPTRST